MTHHPHPLTRILIPTLISYLYQSKLEVSTNQMKSMMSDLEDRADALTALALFSVKSVDKKIAFIVGLVSIYIYCVYCICHIYMNIYICLYVYNTFWSSLWIRK
jgi:hypothetical protein